MLSCPHLFQSPVLLFRAVTQPPDPRRPTRKRSGGGESRRRTTSG